MSKALADLKRVVMLRGGIAAVVQTLLTNVFILGINVGTGVITARLLEPSGRGEQAAMMMWPSLMAYALTLGLPSALLYNLKRRPDSSSQLFSAALILGTSMGLVATLTGVLFIPLWLLNYSPEVVRFAQELMVVAPLGVLSLAFTYVLQAREEFGAYNASRYSMPLLTLFAIVLLASTHYLTPFNAAMAYVLPVCPVFVWMLVRLWRLYRPVWRGLRSAFRNLTSYGLRSYGVDLLGPQVAGQLDKVLVVGLLDPAMMGLYVVAWSLARTLDVFQAAVVSVLFPKVSGRGVQEVVALVGQSARVSITMTLLAAAGLALFGPWVLGLVYGQEYLDAVFVFRLLLLEAVIGGATLILAQAFMALDRPEIVSVLQGVGVILSVPLLIVLVPIYGIEGAGLALLISTAARLASVIASFPLILKVRIPSLRPRREDFARFLPGRDEH